MPQTDRASAFVSRKFLARQERGWSTSWNVWSHL